MAGQPIVAGCSYHVITGNADRHLFVLVAGPADIECYPPQTCVLVCLCTIRQAQFDQSCIVEAGEHPFVVARSYVAYNWSRQQTVPEIVRYISNNGYTPAEPFDEPLLMRVRAGLQASDRTPNALKQFCAACPP